MPCASMRNPSRVNNRMMRVMILASKACSSSIVGADTSVKTPLSLHVPMSSLLQDHYPLMPGASSTAESGLIAPGIAVEKTSSHEGSDLGAAAESG